MLLALGPACARGEDGVLPRWELGVGVGGLYAADYIGSDQYQGRVLPIPYGVYRGEIWRVDRDGISGRLFGTDRLKLDASFGFALPVRSDDNEARRGMDDLDGVVEVGPSIEWIIRESASGYGRWWFDNRLRAAFRVDIDAIDHQGWVYQSRIRYRYDVPRPGGYFSGQFSTSLLFADDRFHDYFYGVDPEFATPERPAYTADSGYSGLRMTLSGTRRIGRLWLGLFLRYDNISGATFEDSPLVKTDDSWFLGFGAAWVIAQSKD